MTQTRLTFKSLKQLAPAALVALLAVTGCTKPAATSGTSVASATAPPAFSAIKEEDLRRDLFAMASDSLRGRRAGETEELRAAAWTAERAREAGLEPAGDDGTYFQFFPLRRTQVSPQSQITLAGRKLALNKEVWVTSPVEGQVTGTPIWLNALSDITRQTLRGKIVAMKLMPPSPLPAPGMSLWGYRYILSAVRQQGTLLTRAGAAAIVLIADSTTQASLAFAGHGFEEGTYQLEGGATQAQNNSRAVPILIALPSAGGQSLPDQLRKSGGPASIHVKVDSYLYPSANVVARAPGTDPTLKNEYVLFSGHHDHDGVGTAIDGDSIWNGADDNATVNVALLAIARAWKQNPGQRSALFVWHGAEERGLLGSRWYAENPTVKKEALVAVLNGDMIGRNAPDSAALLGSTKPHRNSAALVDMALQANQNFTKFKLDTSWDDQKHPEGWYFRSDHLPYARAGIPAIFFTTLLHPDYHTPKDEANRINIQKLARMTRWMYATGWAISNTPQRPTVDPDFKLER
ncbi:M28 family metallopeptidase [Rufibacter sediminis]|uniref:M28 family peptidase n=1 Tax=Rufibacter sediminis TaxID=2762756 RepID=A0ABR6VVX3_9BACT|nr:M28 family peptidase [Rufibacter sediminis]MBC3541351.1 M28 family peptidase [Rufibacter sediminis]